MEQKFRPQDQTAYLAEVAAFNKGFHDLIVSPDCALQVKIPKSGSAKGMFACYFEDKHLKRSPFKILFDQNLSELLAPGLWIDPLEVRGTKVLAKQKFGSSEGATFIIESFALYQPAVAVTGEYDLQDFNARKELKPYEVGVYSNWERKNSSWDWCPRLYCDTSRFGGKKSKMKAFLENRIAEDVVKPAHKASEGIKDIWEADPHHLFYSEFFKSIVSRKTYANLWNEYTERVEEAFENPAVPQQDTYKAVDGGQLASLYAGVAKA
jgi:hypothetical protein